MRTTARPNPRNRKSHRRRRVPPTTVIVGAGIAGLTIAERLIAAGTIPASILIVEKYDYVGGRVVSHRDGYEIGAGRIHTSHRHVAALLDRYHLETVPLGTETQWMPVATRTAEPNYFEKDLRAALTDLTVTDHAEAGKHTIRQLLSRHMSATTLSDLLDRYPYRAETETIRADLGIRSFRPRAEMGSHTGYYVVRGGLSSLIRAMRDDLTAAGVRFLLNAEVTNIAEDGSIQIHGRVRPLRPARTVLALHAHALQRILPSPTGRLFSRYLRMEPLTRIYAAYPPDHIWTRTVLSAPPIVSDSPLRYIIPINPVTGVVMISYTEGRDTHHWHGLTGRRLQRAIQREVLRLWPDAPEPTWVRPYEWTGGCTYWRPGDYDPETVARQLQHPYPTVWVAGESLSVGRQAWMEGALEVAHAVADIIN